MANKSININHPNSAILSNDGSYLQINKNGAVKLGYGINLSEGGINNTSSETMSDYKGTLRFNIETLKLEYCNGSTWVPLLTENDDADPSIIYSMLF